jgi:hypothetical protein
MANEGSRFIVDLGDFKLPPLVEKQVEAEIRATVLRALAENGFGGDPRVPQARISSPIWDQFPGQTLGLWPGWPQDKPPVIFGSGGVGPLTVGDHTLIMRAIMEHPMQLLRYLPSKYKSKNGGRPSGGEVLQAALQVEQIDDYTKGRIRRVLEVLPEIEARQASLPEPAKRTVDDLHQQLANKTTEEQRSLLRDAGARSRQRQDGLADGMEVAARMLEDGADSIYTPEFSFYKLLQEGQAASRAVARDAISDIGSMDTIGATAGGAVGSVAGGVGAGPGAVAGGVGASAGAAAVHLVHWVISWF